MLDVHPPEHAAHTWRDFFIHIIVLALIVSILNVGFAEHLGYTSAFPQANC